MKAIVAGSVAHSFSLHWQELPIPRPSSEQLLVKVAAVGVNRADILQKKGKYLPPPGEGPVLGLELAGEIVAKGDAVVSHELGQRVFGLVGSGAYAEYALIDKEMAIPITPAWSYEQAASVTEAYITAYETLFTLGQLKEQETLLLHAAASGVGTAALQLAKAKGAKVIAMVGSPEKAAAVKELGADWIIDRHQENWIEQIRQLASGIDVISDFIGGEYFGTHLDLLSRSGRLIMIAFMQGYKANCDLRPILEKSLQIKGFVLRTRPLAEKRQMTKRFVQHVLPSLIAGSLKPVIDKVFPFTQVEEAHEYLEQNKNIGKIILKM